MSKISVESYEKKTKEKAVKMKLWLSGHVKMNVSQVIRDFRPQSQKGFMLKTVRVGKSDIGDKCWK